MSRYDFTKNEAFALMQQLAARNQEEFVQALTELAGYVDYPNTDEYKEFVATAYNRVDPSKGLKTPLYLATARHSWNCYWESVALRRVGAKGVLKVFMTKRDETDPDWNGYWHVPGTALRPGDSESDPVARLAKEYGVSTISLERVGDAGFGWFKPGDPGRGPGISFVFSTLLSGEPPLGERRGWFDVEHLPEPTVPSHINQIIPMAVEAYHRSHYFR